MNRGKLVGHNSSKVYNLKWYGPYEWYGRNSIFAHPLGKEVGIYLFTVPFEGNHLIYYVGETGRSFTQRFLEHTQAYLSGLYRVYEPTQFMSGKKVLVWGGMWKTSTRINRMEEFLNRYSELSPIITQFLQCMRVFIAPLKEEKKIIERIEAAVAQQLYGQTGIVGAFQDNDIRYRPKRNDEEPIIIKMSQTENLLGIRNQIMG